MALGWETLVESVEVQALIQRNAVVATGRVSHAGPLRERSERHGQRPPDESGRIYRLHLTLGAPSWDLAIPGEG